MDKMTKVVFIIWIVLALASFGSAFFAPLVPKIIGIVFGSFNLLIIGAWVSSLIEGRREYKKQQKLMEEK